jgi:hypothetical protein
MSSQPLLAAKVLKTARDIIYTQQTESSAITFLKPGGCWHSRFICLPHAVAALVPVTHCGFTVVAMACKQQTCQSTQKATVFSSLDVQLVDMQGAQFLAPCDLLFQRQTGRLSIKHCMRCYIGICVTRRLISSKFVQSGFDGNVGQWCSDCQTCQCGSHQAASSSSTDVCRTCLAFLQCPCQSGSSSDLCGRACSHAYYH